MLDLTALTTAELSVLVKAMHEARFAEVVRDPIVWRAPFAIDLHVAALDEWTRRRAEQSQTHPRDERFYRWRGRPEHQTILRRIDEDALLRRDIATQGVDYVRELLRPFVLDDAIAAELVEHATRPTAVPAAADEAGRDREGAG